MDCPYEIQPYAAELAGEWDDFVWNHSANGNLFHTREFLSYHPDERFKDASILLREHGRIVAVVAANRTEVGWSSHSGTSCGGPVISRQSCGVRTVQAILEILNAHYQSKLGLRLCEPILGGTVNELLLYLLHKTHAIQPEISAYKPLANIEDFVESIPHKKTRSATRKCFSDGFATQVAEDEADYRAFHKLLVTNLQGRHETEPTHTLEELLQLRRIIDTRQNLILGRDAEGHLCTAVWLIEATPMCWHVQYIARDYSHTANCAVEATLCKAMEAARHAGAEHLNIGVCTESGGTVLNAGLLRFKESLGCLHHNRHLITPKE